MFDDEVVRQPSDEVSQDKKVAAHGGENLADRDITEYEWAMQCIDSNKQVVLLTTRIKGRGQLIKDRPFSYGRILQLDYEDPDSENLVLLVECSKGVRKMWVSEDYLVKDSCGPESFRQEVSFTNDLITSLRPYIQGHVSYKERSPSPKKVATKKKPQSKPQKRKNQNYLSLSLSLQVQPMTKRQGQHQEPNWHLVCYHLTKIK